MNTATLGTLAFSQRLREGGLDEKQAESIVGIVRDAREQDQGMLATKSDLVGLENSLEAKIRELELRMTIKTGTMVFALGGLMVGLKLFAH